MDSVTGREIAVAADMLRMARERLYVAQLLAGGRLRELIGERAREALDLEMNVRDIREFTKKGGT